MKIKSLIASTNKNFLKKLSKLFKGKNNHIDIVDKINPDDIFKKNYDIIVIDDSVYNEWEKLHKDIKEHNINNIFISIVDNVNLNKLREAFRDGVFDIIHQNVNDNEIAHVFLKAYDTAKIMKSNEKIIKYCIHKIFIEIPSDVNLVNETVMQIINTAKLIGFIKNKDMESNLRLVYTEAIVNAIVHGNKSDKDKKVKIDVEITESKIKVIIEDMGKGFDFNRVNDPLDDSNLLKSSGRGIYLIKAIMDKIEFKENGRKIVLIKQRE